MTRPLWIALACCVVCSPVRADLLYFAHGGEIQHSASIRDGVVRLDTPAGRFEFLETDFRAIVPDFDPAAEWPARLVKARLGSTADRLASAWWALENGLVDDATALIRETHRDDPSHPLASRLVAVLDRLDTISTDPDTTNLRHALGVACESSRGPHILLLHQHSEADAKERIALLEQVVTAYYLLLTWHGVEIQVPQRRLASVYLKAKSDYITFLKSNHAGAFSGTFGYYHPTLRAMVAFDLRSAGKLRDERMTLDRFERQSQTFSDERRREWQRRRLLYELEYRALDHGTAAHEIIHQLVMASGLIADASQFPQWLHEGFAAQFEVIRGGRWAGISRAHDLRLVDWRKLREPPELLPLIRDQGFGHGYRPDVYARSWAIVYFLQKKNPARFWTFLDRLRDSDRLGRDAPKPEDVFLSVFGPDSRPIESEWRAFMRSVSTPLDDHRPESVVSPR